MSVSLRGAADTQAPTCATPMVRVTSGTGERVFETLPDGSRLALNTDSEIIATCSPTARFVRVTKGEALLRFKHERGTRPFFVWSRDTLVEDIGTGADIRIREHSVEVAVTEGSVRIHPKGVVLHKGGHATIRDDGELEILPNLGYEELARLLAWRDGRVWFDRTPVAQAISEFNRYNERKILFQLSPHDAQRLLGGSFDNSDIDGFTASVRNALAPEKKPAR
jgi:transmembrane sensor